MSKHWNPDEELAGRSCPQHDLDRELVRQLGVEELARATKAHWPEGATVGVLAVAASCLAIGLVLYHAAGPRTVIEESVSRGPSRE